MGGFDSHALPPLRTERSRLPARELSRGPCGFSPQRRSFPGEPIPRGSLILRLRPGLLFYDWLVGQHRFDYIGRVLERHCGVPPSELQKGCRELFRRHFPDVNGGFPKETTYDFSDEPQPENGYALAAPPHQAPVWR